MSIATPREIATDALTGYALGTDITREDVWQLIVDVIEAERAADFDVPEPLAGVIQVGEFNVFRNAQGERLVDVSSLNASMDGELILVRQDGSTATIKGDWETGWSA
ncbi:hypothetical protein SEA_WHEELIE_86 [Microbacterium phage Wheelie]|nr:hypothetical protein SEA_PHABIA_86 [Microbacterium phage Phabia]UVG34037.1 hypothetical protein SEA_WHEELIE_86 [Microbacterium phage Wheelie]WNM75605.1 hypothetical protein SEA_WAYNE3_88 [Microbacterium phage Wayne3]